MTSRAVKRQDGFTLIELVVAMTVGMVVLFALYDLVDKALPATTKITSRVDAEQRGRVVLERIERELRSVVCIRTSAATGANATYLTPFDTPSNDSQVTFYSYLPSPADTSAQTFTPQKRQISFDAASGTLSETVWTTSGSVPSLTFISPTTRTLLTNVSQEGGGPVFTYYAYADNTSAPQQIFPTGSPSSLSATDLPRVAQVGISFVAGPASPGSYAAVDSTFDDTVTVPLPTDFSSAGNAAGGPPCKL